MRIDGITYDLSEEIKIEKNKKHTIEIVVDRLVIKEGIKSRLTDSIETVSSLTGGLVGVDVIGGEEMLFSQNYAALSMVFLSTSLLRECSHSTILSVLAKSVLVWACSRR